MLALPVLFGPHVQPSMLAFIVFYGLDWEALPTRYADPRAGHPAPDIVVTGCAAQTAPEQFAGMAEVTRVLGNEEKLSARGWRSTERVAVGNIMTVSANAAARRRRSQANQAISCPRIPA